MLRVKRAKIGMLSEGSSRLLLCTVEKSGPPPILSSGPNGLQMQTFQKVSLGPLPYDQEVGHDGTRILWRHHSLGQWFSNSSRVWELE